jgi:hypothetical protein
MQRRPDQFIGDGGAVVLGRVEVIDAESHRAAQDGDSRCAVARRTEYPGPGSCIAPKPTRDTVTGPRT